MSSNLGHLGSKIRSLGQIKEIPCGRSRGHSSCSFDLKIGQNVLMKSWTSSNLVTWAQTLGHWLKLKKYIVGALEDTVLAHLT